MSRRIYGEWEEQECLLLALPHEDTDWKPYLDEIINSYEQFLTQITKYQSVKLLCKDANSAKIRFSHLKNIEYIQAVFNDTWIRDYGVIDIEVDGKLVATDFTFNAWGGKFESNHDNKINEYMYKNGFLAGEFEKNPLILEGGSIDSNGEGVMLTTTTCLLNQNRNNTLTKDVLDEKLKDIFGLKNLIWLSHGELSGDDTDAHVDTLARFITSDTIAYVSCEDESDEHYESLKKMEDELKNTGFNLLPLPLPKPIYYDGERLPATYVNFIFVNGALIVPTYNQPSDEIALERLQKALIHVEVLGVDSQVFIRQHGSLHCSCMQRFKRV